MAADTSTGYRLSELSYVLQITDTERQRRLGRGQTLVLLNGCNGEVTQTATAVSSSLPWPLGFTHYQIPTQGTAIHFRKSQLNPSTIAPVNGAGASDGYRAYQFAGDFQDSAATNAVNGTSVPTGSNTVIVANPLAGDSIIYNTIDTGGRSLTAVGTDSRLFVLGGYAYDNIGSSETSNGSSWAVNPANLVAARWGDYCHSVSGNSETDGDIVVVTAGRSVNSNVPDGGMRYFNISTPAGAFADSSGKGANILDPAYPAHGSSGSASDESRIIIAGGTVSDIDQISQSTTFLCVAQSTISQRGFRIPVLSRNFGDLTQARVQLAGSSDGSRAVFVGGSDTIFTAGLTSGVTNYKTMDMVNISTPANATAFGTVQSQSYSVVDVGGTYTWTLVSTGDVPSRGYAVTSCT